MFKYVEITKPSFLFSLDTLGIKYPSGSECLLDRNGYCSVNTARKVCGSIGAKKFTYIPKENRENLSLFLKKHEKEHLIVLIKGYWFAFDGYDYYSYDAHKNCAVIAFIEF